MLQKLRRILIVSAIFYAWHLPFDVAHAMAQTDQVQAQFVGSGHDGGSFPITTGITKVNLTINGVQVEFSKRDGAGRWPDTCQGAGCTEGGSGGDMGALQYSLGMALNINGQWYASAPVETWFGNNTIGGQIQNQSCCDGKGQILGNWFYDGRWAPLNSAPKPAVGQQVGIFVMAGDARNNFYVVKERSNIVLVTLPAENTEASFVFPAQGGETVNQTMDRVRAKYGPTMTAAQFGAFLNEVAFTHKSEGYALLGKASGNNCPVPTGPLVSCDFLIQNRGGTWFGWDILSDAGEGGAGKLVYPSGDGQDMSPGLNDGSRTVVQATDPGGVTPGTCQDPKANNVGQPLPCTYNGTQGPPGPQGPKGDKGDKGDPGQPGMLPADVADLLNRVTALENQLKALKVPTGCKASANLGFAKISIHCELTY